MARSRSIDYRVGFSGDTSQLEAAIKKATESLTKLGTSPDALRRGLEGASRSALELSQHLNTAFNQDTGKLDLIKFQQSLKASGKSIQDYATSLRSLGPQGEQAFLEVASAIGKAELPLKRTNNLIKQFGVTLWNTARWRVTTGAINAIVGGMQQAMGYAKSLDSSLNNIRIVTGKSAEEMAAFAKEANSAAKALSTTTTTYTDASLIYYQQGLDTEAVKQRTEATIKMANVTGQSAETISSQMTAIWENFDDGSRSLESFGDAMVALGASTAASSKEIAEGLQKFAPIAQTVGLSFDYASAALTTIVANTRESASVAGTALKTLFSRLEGLKLGETLEDGTDLNKYSSALMAVGINIKDVSGNLKDMDSILDELGAKWQSLAKDQQIALAETVGGVRQYAQLVALMDNWADFQKNLVTAQSSEGALQRQADIYAESWEAARQRVKAATEDIYDSFINADQFVKLDDMFTPLLTGIASAVDALGGLTGMLPLVVMLMNNAFGDKIAQSLRDMAVNIGLMTGAEQKRARALQDTVATVAEDLQINYEENSAVGARVQLLQEEVSLQAEINNNIDSMSAAQKAVLDDDIKIASVLREQAIAAADQLEIARELTQERQNAIIATSSARNVNNSNLFGNTNIFGANIAPNVFGTAGSIFDTSTINLATDLEKVTVRLAEKLQEVVTVSTKASNLGKVFQDVAGGTEEARRAAEELLSTYNMPLKGGGVTEIQAKLKQLQSDATNARTALRTALENLHVDPKDINALIMAVQKLTGASSDAATKMDAATNAMARAGEVARTSSSYYTDWAEKIVSIGTAASKAAMALRALSNLGDLFSEDNNQSSIEKLSTVLMSFGMLAPTIAPAIKNIKNAVTATKSIETAKTALTTANEVLAASEAKLTAAETANTAAQAASKTATEAVKAAKAKEIPIVMEVVAAENAEAAAVAKATAADTALTKAKLNHAAAAKAAAKAEKELTAAQAASKLVSNPALLVLGAVVAAVALLVIHLKNQRKAEEELIKSKLESAEASQKELEANQNLIDAYNKSLTALDDTTESKEQLKQAALELAAAYNIEGAALANLTGDYSQFNEIVKQKRIAQLESAKEDTSGYISAKYADDAKFSLGNIANTQEILNDEILSPFIDEFQKISLETLQGDTLEETLNNIATVRERIDEVFGPESNLSIEIRKFLNDAAEQIRQLGTINAELELQTRKFENFGEYSDWTQTYSAKLQSQGLSESESRGVIQTATANAGLDDYARIYEIQTDILNKFEKYPALAAKVKESFKDIAAEGADLAAYMPWSAVNYKDFNYLIAKTKEYTDALQNGSVAAINMTNAQKLLSQISSGFKAKDLKDFEQLLGSDKLKEFLQMSQEGQTAYLNNYIDAQFEQQQRQYQIQIDALTELQEIADQAAQDAKDKLGLTEAELEDLRKKYQVEEANWALALTEMDSFLSKKKQEKESGKKPSEINKAVEGLEKDLREGLENAGITDEQLIDALLQLEDPEKAKEKIKEYFLKAFEGLDPEGDLASYFQAQAESTSYGGQIQETTWTQESEYLAREANARATAEQVKNLGELNKLQREGTVKGKAYEAGILKLAKTFPRATQALKEYNKALKEGTEKEQAEALRELADIVDQEAWGQAIAKIKEANDELAKSNMKLGEGAKALDANKYNQQINKIADALNEVFGSNDITATWVEDHSELIQGWADGTVNTVQSAVSSIRLALYASGEDFYDFLTTIESDSTTIKNIVNALDGISFDIEGYADMSQVINALIGAGATAQQVALILQALGNSKAGFKVSGFEAVQQLLDLGPEGYAAQQAEIAGSVFGAGAGMGWAAALSQAISGMTLQGYTEDVPTDYYTPPSGGGGGSKKNTKDLKKDLKDIEERYHEINRQLERQDRVMTKLDKQTDRTYGTGRLKLFEQQLAEIGTKIELLSKKSEEAAGYLAEDKAVLEGIAEDSDLHVKLFEGAGIEFTTGQEIANYKETLQWIVDQYNAFVDEYTAAMEKATEEQKEELEKQKEQEDKIYEARLEALKKYEDSLDQVNTLAHEIEEQRRQEEDKKLEQITYKMKLVLDVREAKKQINDFSKTIEESFGDALTHGAKAIIFDEQNAKIEMDMYKHYLEEYEALHQRLAEANEFTDTDAIIEELKTLEGNIIESGEALLEWLDTVENMYVEALDAAAERFDWFTNQIAHDTDVLGMIKELYALQNITYKTQQGFDQLQKTSAGQYQGYLRQAQLNREWYEKSSAALQQAQADLDALIAEKGAEAEQDVRYDALKKNRDALLEEANRAQEAMLENAKSAMETARQMYLDQIDRMSYELEQRMTNGIGFDLLEEKYNHFLEESDRFLDPVEEGLETAAWYTKLQNDINRTSNNLYKDRLKALQEEIDLRRENNTLSQYDLDLLEAKYQVLQAEMALEDARNNKNQLRLVRDSNGNWNYEYTSNPNDLATREEELLKAKQNEYEITKERYKELNDELLKMAREFAEEDKKIRQDMANGILTEEEGQARLAELQRYYEEKAAYLSSELTIAKNDMSEAAVTSSVLAAGLSESVLATSSDTIQEIVRVLKDEGGPELIAAAGSVFETLQEALKDNLVDKFGETSEEVQQHIKDIIAGENDEGTLEWMTKEFAINMDDIVGVVEDNFLPSIESYIPRAGKAFEDFTDKIEDTANAIGVDPGNLSDMTQELTDNIDNLYYSGMEAVQMMWEQLDNVRDLQYEYLSWADAVMEVVRAMEELARSKVVPEIESAAGVSLGESSSFMSYSGDLSQRMAQAEWNRRHGDENAAAAYADFESQRYTAEEQFGTEVVGATEDVNAAIKNATDDQLERMATGVETINDTLGKYDQDTKESVWDYTDARTKGIVGGYDEFATGGYTGTFDNGKLAMLHEKELVLNEADTRNILEAVHIMRGISDTVFNGIADSLNSAGIASMALLGSHLGGVSAAAAGGTLEQHVTIEQVNFPGVTSSREIEEAFESLVNDAAQWARRRKG